MKNKINATDCRLILPKLINSLLECTKYMESTRVSGDSGYWEWSDDEYTRAMEVLKEVQNIKDK